MPEPKGSNKENVYGFFDLLEKVVHEESIDALHIFNVDESGFCTVQRKSQGSRSTRETSSRSHIQRGERRRHNCSLLHQRFLEFCPANNYFQKEISDTGYINSDFFTKWLQHFIDFVKPTPDRKVLLLSDGHATYSKNLPAILLALKIT